MRLEGLQLGYHYANEDWLFRHLNMTWEQGQIIGLLGPSGCGKTTLARILANYIKPREGTIHIKHTADDITSIVPSTINPVQMVLQHPEKAVNPQWRVKEILYESWQPDADLQQLLRIQPSWLNRRSNELSIGQLQRICIARALHPQTRFLIADEMTTMLDTVSQAQIWQAMINIVADRQLGLLVISHDEKLIHRLCHDVIYLR